MFAEVPAPAELLQIVAAERSGAPTALAAPSAAVSRSHARPGYATAGRVDSPLSSDSMIRLGHLSPSNGSVRGVTRRSVNEYENVNARKDKEDEMNV